jgi:hypothetical protein
MRRKDLGRSDFNPEFFIFLQAVLNLFTAVNSFMAFCFLLNFYILQEDLVNKKYNIFDQVSE